MIMTSALTGTCALSTISDMERRQLRKLRSVVGTLPEQYVDVLEAPETISQELLDMSQSLLDV